MKHVEPVLECEECGEPSADFYIVDFNILPTKLRKKLHREKIQRFVVCKPCFEKTETLIVRIDWDELSLPKDGSLTHGQIREGKPRCHLCKSVLLTESKLRLYGSIGAALMMSGSFASSECLAFFCGECVDKREISLEP